MKRNAIFWLLGYVKRHFVFVVGVIAFSVIEVLFMLTTTVAIGGAVDCIVGQGAVDFNALYENIFTILEDIVVIFISEWLKNLCTNKIAASVVKDVRNDFIDKIESLPLDYIDRTPHGDLLSRMIADVGEISDGLILGFTELFSGVVAIVSTLVFMAIINYKIAIVVAVFTPISILISLLVAKGSYKSFKAQSETRGELTSLIEETIEEQHTVRAFSLEEKNLKKFESINSVLKKNGTKATFISAITNPATRLVNNMIYAAVGIIGAYFVLNGVDGFTVGMLTSFLMYSNKFMKPFNEISGVITELQSAFVSAKRVRDVMDEQSESSDEAYHELIAEGEVKADGVYFSYDKSTSLIENFNLFAEKGKKVAIVGPTGCGKTTVINLLMRFYDVDKGVISIDGKDTTMVTRSSLRRELGMVLQDSWLKTASIKDNIRYGFPDATDEEVVAAAKRAHAHSFISKLPFGYDTVISDGAKNISAGEKQLLCIARVMLRVPPILLLDEATSSIDAMTERKIHEALDDLTSDRTSIVVAHRLSTIKNADLILVMKDGKIVEHGKHAELLEQNGLYKELYSNALG